MHMTYTAKNVIQNLVIFVGFVWACGAHAGQLQAKEYPIKGVDSVFVAGAGVIEVSQGEVESLRVEADAEVMKSVYVDQTGSKLSLSTKGPKGSWFDWVKYDHQEKEVRYILTVKSLEALELTGAIRGQVKALAVKELKLKLSGAANVNVGNLTVSQLLLDFSGAANAVVDQLTAQKLDAGLSGAANAELKTASSNLQILKVDVSGASNFKAKGLAAKDVRVQASGAANATVHALDSLDIDASGASNVHYLGSPKLKQSTSGASHIENI